MMNDQGPSGNITIIGTGFVADLYMRSLATFPNIKISTVYDRDGERLDAFVAHWGAAGIEVSKASDLADAFRRGDPSLVLNLTNPREHFEVSQVALNAGLHVYSEKPLATEMSDAKLLHALAAQKGLMLASAPCSFLSETAQTVWAAVSAGAIGTPRLIYAELDDDFIPQAP